MSRSTQSPAPLLHDGTGSVTLLLAGDTNLQNRQDPATAFTHVLPLMQAADVVFGHIEGLFAPPANKPDTPDIPHKPGWRHSAPAMAQGLVTAGYAAVSCASNVAYGPEAVLHSLATLDKLGLPHCGIGRNRAEAHQPAIVERHGVRFGFLSYTSVFWPYQHAAGPDTPGCATLKATTAYEPHPRVLEMPGAPARVVTTPDAAERAAMEEDVRRLRAEVDVIVVSCHWGVSSSTQIADYQRILGRAAIDAGADLVMGHHPHVIQEIEVWRGRPIFYSLGNFAFDWERMRHKHKDGLVVRCEVRDRRLARVAVVPVRRDEQNMIAPLDPQAGPGREITERVRTLSVANGTVLTVAGGVVVLEGIVTPA